MYVIDSIHQAPLAQSVEQQTWYRRVAGSSPTVDKEFFIFYSVASDALLAGRLVPCKWNQAWRPSEVYRCIEKEKVNFKSREVNCLKECALALNPSRGTALLLKANMKSYKQLETAAIFFLANLFLKQGIGYVYVMVDFICTG